MRRSRRLRMGDTTYYWAYDSVIRTEWYRIIVVRMHEYLSEYGCWVLVCYPLNPEATGIVEQFFDDGSLPLILNYPKNKTVSFDYNPYRNKTLYVSERPYPEYRYLDREAVRPRLVRIEQMLFEDLPE